MRSYDDRLKAMHARASELRREKDRRRTRALSALCVCACLMLAVASALAAPGLAAKASPEVIAGMRASIFTTSAALGYIVVGVIAFSAGVAATVFCVLLRKQRDMREDGDRDDD